MILDFDWGCFDDFLTILIKHCGAGDAHGVQGIGFVGQCIRQGAGLILKMGDGTGGVETGKLRDGVADVGGGETHDAALIGQIWRRRRGNFGRREIKESRSVCQPQEGSL
jgi:hypothetical protein